MSGAVPLLPKFQFSNNGAPMVNGTVTVYLAGTVTPSNTWQNEALTILNTNPIVLDARGEAGIYLDPALSYKFLLKNAGGVTQWTQDNIKGGGTVAEITAGLATLRADLAASGGSALVGHLPAGAGAAATDVQTKLRESRSTEDFDANPVTGAAEAMAAIKLLDGGSFGSGGTGYTLATLTPIKIMGGPGYAMRYDHKYAKTTSPGTSTNAFEFGNITGFVAGSYRNEYDIEHIIAVGAGKTGTSAGIKQVDAANIRIRGALLYNFNKGLYLQSGLSSSYYDMTMTGNSYGIYAEGGGPLMLAEPNANSFYGLRIYGNDRAVNYIGGANAGILWSGCNFEGNNLAGTPADGRAVISMTGAGQQTFISTHHEGNLGQYGTYYQGADQGKTLTMIGCEHIDGTNTQVHINAGCLLALGSRIYGSGSTHQTYLNTGASATLIESETIVTGDLSNLAALRFGKLAFGATPTTGSPCIYAAPAAINNAAGGVASEFSSNATTHKWTNAAGARIAYLSFHDAFDHDLYADGARGWGFWSNGAKICTAGRAGDPSFESGADNLRTLGSAALRWSTVYAGTGAINTSDEREKQWRGALSPAELAAAKGIALAIGAYQWHSSIADKGVDGARYHIGVKAQQVISIMTAHGLDPSRYGFVCYDEWEADADIEAGNRYGIRADQLAFFIAAAQEQRLAALESLVSK